MGSKTRELDDYNTGPRAVEDKRANWAEIINTALLRAGVAARVDNRSYERQGVERESGHLSRGALEVERRGEQTNRGGEVRARQRRNRWRQHRDEVRAPVPLPMPLREVEQPAPSSHLTSEERAALLTAMAAARVGTQTDALVGTPTDRRVGTPTDRTPSRRRRRGR
jgi:hypothetical protein